MDFIPVKSDIDAEKGSCEDEPLLPISNFKGLVVDPLQPRRGTKICFKSNPIRRIFRRLKDSNTCDKLILALLCYLLCILWVYIQDLPYYGGSNLTCRRYHYLAPESTKSDPVYPYPNTFGVGKKLDWSGAGSPEAFQNIQQLGTHNSYHKMNKPFHGTYWASWFMVAPFFPWAKELRYTHPSIEDQLNMGYRTFELDLHLRPDGVMNYHMQLWDQHTHCYCFSSCLQSFARWSRQNKGHSPIIIMMEPKTLPGGEDSYTLLNDISLENILAVEQEMINVLGGENIITPDSIRTAPGKSMSESLAERGWPSVYHMTDSFIFTWWTDGDIRTIYEAGTNNLEGRLIFSYKYLNDWEEPNSGDNHIIIHGDNPQGAKENARRAIAANQLIRSRAVGISDTSYEDEGAANTAAIAEIGQQIVSSDQYFDEVWAGMLTSCEQVSGLTGDGKTCVRI